MTAPRHGTLSGYTAGCRRRCCRAAKRAYDKRRELRLLTDPKPRLVDAAPTRARLAGLRYLGYPLRDLATRLGLTPTGLHPLVYGHTQRVNRATAERVTRLYRDLIATPGPSSRARAAAIRAGITTALINDNGDNDAA